MSKIFGLILFFFLSLEAYSQFEPPEWVSNLIAKTNLELLNSSEYPYINPLAEGNFGSPIIEGILKTDKKIWIDKSKNIFRYQTLPYYLFLCRDKESSNISKKKSTYEYFSSFKYFIVFAIYNGNTYELVKIYKWNLLGFQKNNNHPNKNKLYTKLIESESNQEYSFEYYKENLIQIKRPQNYNQIEANSDLANIEFIIYDNELYYNRKDND